MMWDAAKAGFKGKFIALITFTGNKQTNKLPQNKISDLRVQIKTFLKEHKNKP